MLKISTVYTIIDLASIDNGNLLVERSPTKLTSFIDYDRGGGH